MCYFFQMYLSKIISLVIHVPQIMNSLAQFMPPFPPIPAPMPGPMIGMAPASIPVIVPPARLPVVVMPYRSPSSDVTYVRRRRRRRPIYDYVSSDFSSSSSDSDTSYYSDIFSSLEYRNRNPERLKKYKRKALRSRRQVLTPVISYLRKDGRVAYHKKIKKENAGDWLNLKRKRQSTVMGSRNAGGNERLKKKHGH